MKIYGASDDIVCVEHGGKHREIDCFDQDVAFYIGDAAIVLMSYDSHMGPLGKDPVWHASIMQADEGSMFPFGISVVANRGYSVIVEIEGSPKWTHEVLER